MPTIPTIKSVFDPVFAQEFPPAYGIVMLDGDAKTFPREDLDALDETYYLVNDDFIPTIARKTNA